RRAGDPEGLLRGPRGIRGQEGEDDQGQAEGGRDQGLRVPEEGQVAERSGPLARRRMYRAAAPRLGQLTTRGSARGPGPHCPPPARLAYAGRAWRQAGATAPGRGGRALRGRGPFPGCPAGRRSARAAWRGRWSRRRRGGGAFSAGGGGGRGPAGEGRDTPQPRGGCG